MIQKSSLKSKGVCRKREYRAASVVMKAPLFDLTAKWCSKSSVIHSIMDIYAFRVIVNDSDTRYRVLGPDAQPVQAASGSRERLYRHSKANGYQSLHTSMIGPHGVPG
ncbi:hypothetical protein O5541_05250 [Escherichia coli]|nr:hypothetical protein [Escherichia coli]